MRQERQPSPQGPQKGQPPDVLGNRTRKPEVRHPTRTSALPALLPVKLRSSTHHPICGESYEGHHQHRAHKQYKENGHDRLSAQPRALWGLLRESNPMLDLPRSSQAIPRCRSRMHREEQKACHLRERPRFARTVTSRGPGAGSPINSARDMIGAPRFPHERVAPCGPILQSDFAACASLKLGRPKLASERRGALFRTPQVAYFTVQPYAFVSGTRTGCPASVETTASSR